MPAQSRRPARPTLKLDWSNSLEDFDVLGQVEHAGSSKTLRAVCRRGRLKDRVIALKLAAVEVPGCRIHQSLYHPNIVSLFSHFAAPHAYIRVMEYCERGSLSELVEASPGSALGEEVSRDFLRNIGSALVYLEGNKIVHRNLEPCSVLVSATRIFKLSNFTNAVTLTNTRATQSACHTISFYSAPEIIAQEPHSFSSDAWSLGCLLLFCHSGPSSVEACSQDSSFFKTQTTLSFLERPDVFQELLSALLQIKPEGRMTCSQALSHSWTQASSSSISHQIDSTVLAQILTEAPSVALSTLEPDPSTAPSTATKKPSLNVFYRRPAALSLSQRAVSEPLVGQHPPGSEAPRRSKSESIKRERLMQFFMKPTPDSLVSHHSEARTVDRSTRSQIIDLSVLSPNEYRFVHGTITILPSRSFLVDVPRSTNCAHTGELQLLLVNPALNTAQLHAATGGPVKTERLVNPKNEWHTDDLPEPYKAIYQEALAHLEELKERTPRLTLHLVNGKCMMMCNTPLPDIEILLRSSFSELSSPKTMLRIRLLRRTKRLEVARRTSHDSSSEWVKRVVTCKDAFPFLPADDWNSLDDLEHRGLRVLERFLPVCYSALELGLQADGMEAEGLEEAEAQDGESTFDSDFTPNFAPDLASSLPPRPLTKVAFSPRT